MTDDAEAAEAAEREERERDFAERATREPPFTRRLRRIGGGLAFVAAALCILAMLGERWWWADVANLRVYVGASDIRACTRDGSQCEEMPRSDFVRAVAGSDDKARIEAVEDWGTGVFTTLGFLVVAAGFLGGIAVLASRHKGTRVAAVTAGVVALLALVPVGRFVRAAPLDIFHRGVHAYVGVAGIFAALTAAALVALPRALGTIPAARVVRRRD